MADLHTGNDMSGLGKSMDELLAKKPIGYATLKVHISVECDAWSDYECEWQWLERSTFDIADPEHFGWAVGVHVAAAAAAVCGNDNVCDPTSVLRGLCDSLRNQADERAGELPPAESSD